MACMNEADAAEMVGREKRSRELFSCFVTALGVTAAVYWRDRRDLLLPACALISTGLVTLIFHQAAHTTKRAAYVGCGPLLLSYQPPSVEHSGPKCPQRHYSAAPGRWYFGGH